jgi:ribosomal protein S6
MNTTLTKNYELLVIFAGNLKESELKKELEKIETEVGKLGKIKNKAVWENHPLAYKIAGQITGSYFICEFATEGKRIPEFEDHLRLDAKIIRHLIYATPKNYVWKDYAAEDLEYDLDKIKGEVKEERKPAIKKPVEKKKSFKDIKVEKPAANVGKTDKQLDDILESL